PPHSLTLPSRSPSPPRRSSDLAQGWTDQLRHSSSAVFAALAQTPSLIEPMRAVYSDLHRRIAEDGLPPGVGEAIAAAIDGLWQPDRKSTRLNSSHEWISYAVCC